LAIERERESNLCTSEYSILRLISLFAVSAVPLLLQQEVPNVSQTDAAFVAFRPFRRSGIGFSLQMALCVASRSKADSSPRKVNQLVLRTWRERHPAPTCADALRAGRWPRLGSGKYPPATNSWMAGNCD